MEKEVVKRIKLMNLVGDMEILYSDGKLSLLDNMEKFFLATEEFEFEEFESEDFDTYFIGLIEKALVQAQVDMCNYIQSSINRVIADGINERYRFNKN